MSRLAGLSTLHFGAVVLALALASAFSTPLCAEDQAAEISDLVAKLASTDWATREKAQRRLVAIGEPARAKLRDALVHTDPEVRTRASAALITLGESFAYALECAKSDVQGKRDHGKAALLNLFRLDNEETLVAIGAEELNRNSFYRDRRHNKPALTAPPAIVLATIEAASGLPVLVNTSARPNWKIFLDSTTASVDMNADFERINETLNQVQVIVNRAVGINDVTRDDRPVFFPMRIGQQSFIYVTTAATNSEPARTCANQLIASFVAGGIEGIIASRLLSAGLNIDPAATAKLRSEYMSDGSPAMLLWVVLHTELDDKTRERVLKTDPAEFSGLLASREWQALQTFAAMVALYEPAARAKMLEGAIATTSDALQLEVALWCARGCEISPEARARVTKCVNNKQDGIASAAARWFAGEKKISDEELAQVWKAAEVQPVSSAFFLAALELLNREDVRPRLVEKAREALAGRFPTQQALAAAVLRGNTTPADLSRVLEKLAGAQDNVLAGKLALLFEGCKELDAAGIEALAAGLSDTDTLKRRRFFRALRRCDKPLAAKVVASAEEKLKAAEEKLGGRKPGGDGDKKEAKGSSGVTSSVPYIAAARIMLYGIKAGQGDGKALALLVETTTGADPEASKAAGAALVDALDSEGLAQTLNALKKKNPTRYIEVATAAYLEQCMRAVEDGNREEFRMASGRVNAVQANNYNWQIMQQLYEMQSQLDAGDTKAPKRGALPADPLLTSFTVE